MSLIDDIITDEKSEIRVKYFHMDAYSHGKDAISIDNGFFFALVINGTAVLGDLYQSYTICKGDLFIQTPSMGSVLQGRRSDFQLIGIYMAPDYFDGLSDSQPLYNQLTKYLGENRLPLFHIEMSHFRYLQKTMQLFSGDMDLFHLYKKGIIRNLCNMLLLQMTDILCQQKENEASMYVKHSNEIFLQFRRLLASNYRKHHKIQFYADKLNISTTYLSRIVKRITGRTVYSHISELICVEAKRLLECTDKDVKEISDLLGFSDQSAFGKFFLKKMGLSPVKYRTMRLDT